MTTEPDRTLRVAQVVSYISADGAFGGPVAVAVAQSQALADLGHRVELYAGWDGAGQVGVSGVKLRLQRAWRRGLPLVAAVAPGLLVALGLKRRKYDVVHVHFGRDISSMLAMIALRGYRGKIVVQPHGMVMPSSRLAIRIVDALVIRPALRRADLVLALTDREERGLAEVSRGHARIVSIRNGVATPTDASVQRTIPHKVLFLARLHPRKNALVFAEAAIRLLLEDVRAEFVIAGPDEGDLAKVQQLIAAAGSPVSIKYIGAIAPIDTRDHLREASLYVLPSVGEVFPMTVLEALAVGTPAVITTDNGLANELGSAGAALIVEPTVESLVRAVRQILNSEDDRLSLAERGLSAIRSQFSSRALAARLVELYR